MKKCKINFVKIALMLCNLILLLSGFCLILMGSVLLNDTPRILLSRLALEPGLTSHPLLYYVALGFIASGMIVSAVAALGFWASWASDSGCLMAMYIFMLVILLLVETSFGVVAALCPQMVGVSMDRDQMVTTLMNNYGVPGRDQYTVAVDFAQTLFKCCGMQSGSDYDGSKWWRREQETHHELRVPRSCCKLSNENDANAFLDPQAQNLTLCQAKNHVHYSEGRYVTGCSSPVNDWIQEHTTIFLIIGLALIIVQLSVLLCAILGCVKRKKVVQPPAPHEYPETPPQTRTPIFTVTKQRHHIDNDFTPKPEEKSMNFYGGSPEENGFSVHRNYQNHIDFHMNTKPFNYSSKKLNFLRNEEFYAGGSVKRNESPVSVPLVLRNSHFQNYEEYRSKQNTDSATKRTLPRSSEKHYQQQQETYFAPKYNPYTRREETSYNNETPRRDGNMKNYYSKNDDFYMSNYNRYDPRQGT